MSGCEHVLAGQSHLDEHEAACSRGGGRSVWSGRTKRLHTSAREGHRGRGCREGGVRIGEKREMHRRAK